MVQKPSTPVIILIALIGISLILAGGAFMLLQQEKVKNQQLEEKIEEISTKQRITESKFEEARKAVSNLELKLQEAKMEIDTLKTNLDQETSARQEAQVKIEQLRVDLDQQKALRSEIEKKLNQAQDDLRKTQTQLQELNTEKATLESKVKNLENKSHDIELGKIVVSPDSGTLTKAQAKKARLAKQKTTPASIPQGKTGQVLVLNKDYNFVVINLGAKDGIENGDLFAVYRQDKYIGDIKVEKVHDAMSAAGFLSDDLRTQISEGDKVIQKK